MAAPLGCTATEIANLQQIVNIDSANQYVFLI